LDFENSPEFGAWCLTVYPVQTFSRFKVERLHNH
jgi:hypothetical protein